MSCLAEQNGQTLMAANNYANSLLALRRFEEVKPLLRKTIPVARRVNGDGNDNTLKLRFNYARALVCDTSATLDDFREAVATMEGIERTARRVLGGTHPLTESIEAVLQNARAALRARETPPRSA